MVNAGLPLVDILLFHLVNAFYHYPVFLPFTYMFNAVNTINGTFIPMHDQAVIIQSFPGISYIQICRYVLIPGTSSIQIHGQRCYYVVIPFFNDADINITKPLLVIMVFKVQNKDFCSL